MTGRLFAVEVVHEIENEVWVLVTDDDLAAWRRSGGQIPAGKDEAWAMARLAEDTAEEWSSTEDGVERNVWAQAQEESVPPDVRDLLRRVYVYRRSDGLGAEVEDFVGLALDRYGRPLPPPPLPGQLEFGTAS